MIALSILIAAAVAFITGLLVGRLPARPTSFLAARPAKVPLAIVRAPGDRHADIRDAMRRRS